MDLSQLPASSTTAILLLLPIALLLYWLILPRPLAGIPYNRSATWTPFGDIPAMIRATPTPGFAQWLIENARQHRSPLIQFFFIPFQRQPSLFLTDHRAAMDLLVHRAADFDTARHLARLVEGILPGHHSTLPTGPEWRARRQLLQDIVSPRFLRRVFCPGAYDSVAALVRRWEAKAEMAGPAGAWDVSGDVAASMMDQTLGFSYGAVGYGEGSGRTLGGCREGGEGGEGVVVFEEGRGRDEAEALMKYVWGISAVIVSPFPRLMAFVMNNTVLRGALGVKKRFYEEQLRGSVERLERGDETWVLSALDHIVAREREQAEKQGREPEYGSLAVETESIALLLAAYETTSTTVQWMLKNLSKNQDAQRALRRALQAAWPDALTEERLPTVAEIHGTKIPYLDAVVEEAMRLANALVTTTKEALRDTTLLGHHVPKGTMVFMPLYGPGVCSPALDSVAPCDGKAGRWDADDIHLFKPERWLVPSGDGGCSFNNLAGPNLAFSFGVRGCFGRRMAYISVRTFVVLVVWRFILGRCPDAVAGDTVVQCATAKPKYSYVRLAKAY